MKAMRWILTLRTCSMMAEPDDGTLERQEEDTTAVEKHQMSVEDDNSLARGRKSYGIATKLRVLSKCNELGGNTSKTAKGCGVSRQCAQDWVRDRESLQETKRDQQMAVRKRSHVPSMNDSRKERGNVYVWKKYWLVG